MLQDIKIQNAILIYNEKCSECNAIQSLYTEVTPQYITVFDNSTNKEILLDNERFCKFEKINYCSFGKNLGLAKAFNNFLNMNIDSEWISFFDQDSIIPKDYHKKLIESIEKYNVNLHAPVVVADNYIMSPRHFRNNIVGSKMKNMFDNPHENITVINSGLTINTEIFLKLNGYNERLFLDYLDHDLVSRYLKLGEKIAIFPSKLQQNFSSKTESNVDADKFRCKIFCQDILEYAEERGIFQKLYVRSLITKRILRLSIKYKTLVFFDKKFYQIRRKV